MSELVNDIPGLDPVVVVSCLRWTQRIKGIPSSLSSCCPESGRVEALGGPSAPLRFFFFFFFCSSKQKYAGLGTLQVVRFPLRGGVKGLGVGCVCSGVSPSI